MCRKYSVISNWTNLMYFLSSGKFFTVLLTLATWMIQIIAVQSSELTTTENFRATDEGFKTNEQISVNENLIIKILFEIYEIGTTKNGTISLLVALFGILVLWALKFISIEKFLSTKAQVKDTELDIMEKKPFQQILDMQGCFNCEPGTKSNVIRPEELFFEKRGSYTKRKDINDVM